MDFDPGPATFSLTRIGGKDAFISKLDKNGKFEWAYQLGSTSGDEGTSIIYSNGFIYSAGYFKGTIDFDPGPGILQLNRKGSQDFYLNKMDPEGNFIWAANVGGSNAKFSNIALVLNGAELLVSGIHSGGLADFDPSAGSKLISSFGAEGFFSLKLSEGPCSNITIKFDSISNITCNDSGYAQVVGLHGVPPYSYTWLTVPPRLDSIAKFDSSAFYSIIVKDSTNCLVKSKLLIAGPPDSVVGNIFDLNANLVSTTSRPGQITRISLDAVNNGCYPTSGLLKLMVDTIAELDSVIFNRFDTIYADTLVWRFSNLNYDSSNLKSTLLFEIDTTAKIGDSVCFYLEITPISGDFDSTNNIKKYCFPVRNGYDPNDKKVYPPGLCTPNFVRKNDLKLTYTIRFQNTGNAKAIDVIILDSLDQNLNINSVKVIGSSHDVYTELVHKNVLKFNFNNINLIDSITNESESHGYLIFEVLLMDSIASGTKIENKSDIIFDLNPPIITNTVQNTVVDTIPQNEFIDVIQACQSYTWRNGVTYYTSNYHEFYDYQNQYGCDSTYYLNLTIDTVNTEMLRSGDSIIAVIQNANYQWLNCDNAYQEIIGESDRYFIPDSNGNYAVEINYDGCIDTSDCMQIKGLGINELRNNELVIFPNPTSEKVSLRLPGFSSLGLIRIINIHGALLFESKIYDLKSERDVVTLNVDYPAGVYFIQVINDSNSITRRLVVQ